MLARLAKTDLLVIDDWGLAPLTPAERRDLLEVLEDRTERGSTLITSQVPVTGGHDLIGEPTHADVICDRLIHTAYVLELQELSLRETRARAQPGGLSGGDTEPPSANGPPHAHQPSQAAVRAGRAIRRARRRRYTPRSPRGALPRYPLEELA